MKPSPFHFRYKPKGGKMILEDPQQMRTFLEVSEAKSPDTVWEGDLYPVKRKRSLQQNKVIWGLWMPIIMDELYGSPYSESDCQKVYSELKIEMGWVIDKVNRKTGEIRKFPRDTHDLNTADYSVFMENFCRHVAMNHQIFLPDPEPTKARI